MSLLFISHSSKDKDTAEWLVHWLEENGFDSIFLDSDAKHGIKAGSDWEKTLYRAIQRSHAFIFLISDNWISSQWCGFEFMQARALGKTIFPIRIQAGLETQVASDIQHIDFTKDLSDSLKRLQAGINEIILNSRHSVRWEGARSPYPGMMAFEAEDAPVFFGRDKEIHRLRERLDQHRTQGSASILTLIAASGSGKSSLLKAGLLPCLQNDRRHWLLVDTFRPEREPLRKLAEILATATKQVNCVDTIFLGLQSENATDILRSCIKQLQGQRQVWSSTLLLTIDQAEELFTTAEPKQTKQFLDLLLQAQVERLPVLTLLAMRSDYLDTLQKKLIDNDTGVSLSNDLLALNSLPLEQIGELIRGPAKVAGLIVEDGLLSAAIDHSATTDALPLLAFTLRELYERFGHTGCLTLENYQQLGSDQLNPLENVVQEKAAQAIQAEQLSKTKLKALRDAFIPHMVRINDNSDYVRQPARWTDLPEESYELLEKLTNARLLVQHTLQVNGQRRKKLIEVSHEALFRNWTLLNNWLTEEHDFLLGKQLLEHNLRDWEKLPEASREKGLLQGISLERSLEWLLTNKAGLTEKEKKFIKLSHEVEENKKKQQRNRLMSFIGGVLITAGIAVWQAFTAINSENIARENLYLADQQSAKNLSFIAVSLLNNKQPYKGLMVAQHAVKKSPTINNLNILDRAISANNSGSELFLNGASGIKRINNDYLLVKYQDKFIFYKIDGTHQFKIDLSTSGITYITDIIFPKGDGDYFLSRNNVIGKTFLHKVNFQKKSIEKVADWFFMGSDIEEVFTNSCENKCSIEVKDPTKKSSELLDFSWLHKSKVNSPSDENNKKYSVDIGRSMSTEFSLEEPHAGIYMYYYSSLEKEEGNMTFVNMFPYIPDEKDISISYYALNKGILTVALSVQHNSSGLYLETQKVNFDNCKDQSIKSYQEFSCIDRGDVKLSMLQNKRNPKFNKIKYEFIENLLNIRNQYDADKLSIYPGDNFYSICSNKFIYSTSNSMESTIKIIDVDLRKVIYEGPPFFTNGKEITDDCKLLVAAGSYQGTGGFLSEYEGIHYMDLTNPKAGFHNVFNLGNIPYYFILQNPLTKEFVTLNKDGNLYVFDDLENLLKGDFYISRDFDDISVDDFLENKIKIKFDDNGNLLITFGENVLYILSVENYIINEYNFPKKVTDIQLYENGYLLKFASFSVADNSSLLRFFDRKYLDPKFRKELLMKKTCSITYGRNLSVVEWNELISADVYQKNCDNWPIPDSQQINLR